ncbi:MAG: hypothetical protein ACRDRW_22000 [Pseudonocardiaceae bacterium]
MPIDTITGLIADISAIDWNNLAAVTAASDKLLTALGSDRPLLRELAERALGNPHLLGGHQNLLRLVSAVGSGLPLMWRSASIRRKYPTTRRSTRLGDYLGEAVGLG